MYNAAKWYINPLSNKFGLIASVPISPSPIAFGEAAVATTIRLGRPDGDAAQIRLDWERHALAAAAGNDGIYDWDLRSDRIYYSPILLSLFGLTETDMGDRPESWLRRVHPDDLIWLQATLDAQANCGGKPFQIEFRFRHGNGDWHWMLCRGLSVLDAAGEPVRIVGAQTDITEHKLAKEQLRQSEERYALAALGANDGLWDWRIPEGDVFYSARWMEMLGLPGGERTGRIEDWIDLVHPEDRSDLESAVRLHLAGGSDHLEREVRVRHTSGAERWVLIRGVAIREANGAAVRMAGSMTDITARKRAEQQLLFDAFHDGLTGLPNRSLLLDRISQALDRRLRPGDPHHALILLDLDHFNTINDSLGPLAGDQVLRVTAQRLQQTRQPGDTVARIASDEFAVLVSDASDTKAALAVAQRVAAALAAPITLSRGETIVLTISCGISLSDSGYTNAGDMLRDASLAMVRAKAAGRNRIEMFDRALHDQAIARLRMETDLRQALDNQELRLVYQPIVRFSDRRIAGFEALIRWQHPQRGLIGPAEFVPLAEETGLILGIGRWAMMEAARRLALWQQSFDPTLFVSVNVSARQMLDDDVVSLVRDVLLNSGVPPSALRLEITESLLMDDPNRCAGIMQQIRDLGVSLSLDDFGTGFSSLSYLHRYPVSTLKIDRSFVRATGAGDRRAAIARLITLLAEAMDLDVVAEGIESEAEADYLGSLTCQYGQGYFFSPPVPDTEAEAMLARQAMPATGQALKSSPQAS